MLTFETFSETLAIEVRNMTADSDDDSPNGVTDSVGPTLPVVVPE